MLTIDQNERATLDDIINSNWVTNYQKENLRIGQNKDEDHALDDFGNLDRLINTQGFHRSNSVGRNN